MSKIRMENDAVPNSPAKDTILVFSENSKLKQIDENGKILIVGSEEEFTTDIKNNLEKKLDLGVSYDFVTDFDNIYL